MSFLFEPRGEEIHITRASPPDQEDSEQADRDCGEEWDAHDLIESNLGCCRKRAREQRKNPAGNLPEGLFEMLVRGD
jgi:hypothetical protein